MQITTVGLDLAKNVFQVHGVDEKGRTVLKKRLARKAVTTFFANLTPCLIGLEAQGSSNYWARELIKLGHEVKLMSPQFVKPYLKKSKNDQNDAEAICEAVGRPNMRFVPLKTLEQQDVQTLHRIRERLVGDRTAMSNQIRGLLAEYGIIVPRGIASLKKALPGILEDAGCGLTPFSRELFFDLKNQLLSLDGQVKDYDRRILAVFKANPVCHKLARVPGVGPLTATAMVAAVGNASSFKNGRQLAAWLGLVPRQHSSGGKTRLLGISKRGDSYLRRLLVHGARAVVSRSDGKTDARSRWLNSVKARRGANRATVALANKNARMLWVLLRNQTEFDIV